MKAILVVDIGANELPKDAYANVYIFGKYCDEQEDDFIALKADVPLKPMPEKVVVDMSESHEAYWQIGWNDCIEEIEK